MTTLRAELEALIQRVRDTQIFPADVEKNMRELGIETLADAFACGRDCTLAELDALTTRADEGEAEAVAWQMRGMAHDSVPAGEWHNVAKDYFDYAQIHPMGGIETRALYLHPAAQVKVPEALSLPTDGAYIIKFDDASVDDLFVAGPGARDAALAKYAAVSPNWNAHLFVKIDSNSRAEWCPSATFNPGTQAAGEVGGFRVQVAKLSASNGVTWVVVAEHPSRPTGTSPLDRKGIIEISHHDKREEAEFVAAEYRAFLAGEEFDSCAAFDNLPPPPAKEGE